jgi:DNA gyrase subunit A
MSRDGQILRTAVEDISTFGRNTMGVIVMDLDPDDEVAAVDVVSTVEDTDDVSTATDADDVSAVEDADDVSTVEDADDVGDA